MKQNVPAAAAYLCVSDDIVQCSSLVKRRDLGRTMSFRSPDIVHYFHSWTQCLHRQSCEGQMVLENLLSVLDEEEVLVQWVRSLKRFGACFEVLHFPHPNPWTYAFRPSAIHSAASMQQFSFPSALSDLVSVSFLVLVMTLNGRSRDFCGSTVAESSSAP